MSVGADPLQPLSDVQQLIEQETHIMVEQQSLLILGGIVFAARPVPVSALCLWPPEYPEKRLNHGMEHTTPSICQT